MAQNNTNKQNPRGNVNPNPNPTQQSICLSQSVYTRSDQYPRRHIRPISGHEFPRRSSPIHMRKRSIHTEKQDTAADIPISAKRTHFRKSTPAAISINERNAWSDAGRNGLDAVHG